MTGQRTTGLLVGLGNRDRGDDAVGPMVAVLVAERLNALRDSAQRDGGDVPLVRVVEQEDPAALLDLWAEVDLAVVVDAVRAGRAPGHILVLRTGAAADPLPAEPWAAAGRQGTHALGLACAVELSRALGRLPPQLAIVGVEAEGFALGAELSPPVARAVPAAAGTAWALLTESGDHPAPSCPAL
ncbi:MAG: hydrogenase maturation protease [Dactylosporangium sp.]|nr:hydrogenase maturation protease [Dactylosporangium sp.]NNJ60428.1 hydrogenase maturation protease [Dactylosporangium sp.]